LERRAYEARVADLQQHLLAANSELGAASLTDCLTQIGNRRAFEQHIADEITRANRINYTLALLMIDIDHFKHFNDEFGHPMGDQIIRLVAHCITHTVRATDFAARLGGDEFVVILPGTDLLGARIIAERVRLKIEQLAYPMHPVHVSVGIGRLATGRADASSLMADADRSLRRAKESGRNRVVGSVEPDTALGHDSQVNVSNKLSG
jgi:diguanylate cyclase (GGDEF)-like protein